MYIMRWVMAYSFIGSSIFGNLQLFLTKSMSMQMSDEAEVHFHGVSGRTILRPNEVNSFENECVILGHPKLFNQLVVQLTM